MKRDDSLHFRPRLLVSRGGDGPPPAPIAGALARGVHRAPYTIGGRPALLAISSSGARVAEIVIPPGVDPLALAAATCRVLELADPAPAKGPVQ